uniref:Uncharacterized protein n=1 Tax=Timema douglasi TaxID=61478 RepID=A0A7R8Z3M4_TIMDO|nr:unnamed protein product [Timema douglasi]
MTVWRDLKRNTRGRAAAINAAHRQTGNPDVEDKLSTLDKKNSTENVISSNKSSNWVEEPKSQHTVSEPSLQYATQDVSKGNVTILVPQPEQHQTTGPPHESEGSSHTPKSAIKRKQCDDYEERFLQKFTRVQEENASNARVLSLVLYYKMVGGAKLTSTWPRPFMNKSCGPDEFKCMHDIRVSTVALGSSRLNCFPESNTNRFSVIKLADEDWVIKEKSGFPLLCSRLVDGRETIMNSYKCLKRHEALFWPSRAATFSANSECHLEGLTREPGESRVEAYFQAQGAGLTAAEECSNPLLLPVTFGDGNNEKSEKCEEEITSSDECEGSSKVKFSKISTPLKPPPRVLMHSFPLKQRKRHRYYSSPVASLVLTDSSQLTAAGFEKLPDKIMSPYAEPDDLQEHVFTNEIWSWYHVVIIPLTTCVLSDDLQVEGLQGQGVCRHLQYGGSALPQVAQLAHFLAVTVHDVDRRDGGTYDVDVFSGPRLSPYRSRAVVVQLCVNCFSGAGGTHRDVVASLRFPSFTGQSECPCSRRVAASIEPHREQGGRLFERRATRLPVSHIFIGEQIDRPT